MKYVLSFLLCVSLATQGTHAISLEDLFGGGQQQQQGGGEEKAEVEHGRFFRDDILFSLFIF